MTNPTDMPTLADLDAALVEAVAAELRARRAGISDDQIAAMNEIVRIREQQQQLRWRNSK